MFIYIPLCIYFNSESASGTSSSVMIYIPLCIYFNIVLNNIPRAAVIIYIPLCIYFNLGHLELSHAYSDIYIPLCIYFNNYPLSNLTVDHIHLHSTMYLFQRPGCDIEFTIQRNLHSTMYLFQPLLLVVHQVMIFIYIPLCIYFNWIRSGIYC